MSYIYVWPPMRYGTGHAQDNFLISRLIIKMKDSGYAAHEVI